MSLIETLIFQFTKQLWTLRRSMIILQSRSVHHPHFCLRIFWKNTIQSPNLSRAARTIKKGQMVTTMAMQIKINSSLRELLMRIRSTMSSVQLLQEVASHHASPTPHTLINNWNIKSTTQRPKQPITVKATSIVTKILAGKYWRKNKRVQLPVRYLGLRNRQRTLEVDKLLVITTSHRQLKLIPITNLSSWLSRHRLESKRAVPIFRHTLILTPEVILSTLLARKMALILLRRTRVLRWTSTCAMSWRKTKTQIASWVTSAASTWASDLCLQTEPMTTTSKFSLTLKRALYTTK